MTQVYAVFGGIKYRWSGWAGCQLESFEWLRPPAGTTRVLDFGIGKEKVKVTVFTTERSGWLRKCRCTWAVSNSGDMNEHNARIWALKHALAGLW